MNQQENAYYQRMIFAIRKRHNSQKGWPGKPLNAPAVTMYPNILAEIEAHGGWLWYPARCAGVSQEILAAVLEDGEDLTLKELFDLCHSYECDASYMAAPTLQMVDPAANKGKYRLRQLSDLLSQVDKLKYYPLWRIEQTRDTLERGEPVTFADWRRGCDEIREELERRKRKGTRTSRIGGRVIS